MIRFWLRHPILAVRGTWLPIVDTKHPERTGFYRRGRRFSDVWKP